MVTSTTVLYEAQTMCKTRFDSQGIIINKLKWFRKKHLKETLMTRKTPRPFMEKCHKMFPYFLNPPLMTNINQHINYPHITFQQDLWRQPWIFSDIGAERLKLEY